MNPAPSFSPVILEDQEIGYSFESSAHLFFFGTRFATREILSELYPQLQWSSMRQEHGNKFAQASQPTSRIIPIADALWTPDRHIALLVSTADCVPVLVATDDFVASIHAGWRGILNGIAPLCIETLRKRHGFKLDNALAIIGPHIQQKSFDFTRDDATPFFNLASKLELNTNHAIQNNPGDPTKVKISLNLFIRAQLTASGLTASRIAELPVNTHACVNFHSYRRERVAGRNLSFVARL